jgi:hypothetical protein
LTLQLKVKKPTIFNAELSLKPSINAKLIPAHAEASLVARGINVAEFVAAPGPIDNNSSKPESSS